MLIKKICLLLVNLSLPFLLFAEPASSSKLDANSQQKIKDFYLSNLKEDGSKDWEVKGKEAILHDKYVDIDKMEAKYYSDKDTIQVKSEKAKVDRETKNADLQDNVELKIPNKDGTFVTVNCSGPLEMRYNDGMAVFNNNVVVDNAQGKLYSDKATVYFDTKDKTKMKIVAEGHVKIVKENNIAFADKATYTGESKNVVLEGSPRLIYFSKKNETPGNK
ncbi:MAG: LptA/OstA family protein [Candidatus Omnitrophica bacterium]|nr:LptA/OstA family protein [Candidatus Omnitrophota bacterium]